MSDNTITITLNVVKLKMCNSFDPAIEEEFYVPNTDSKIDENELKELVNFATNYVNSLNVNL